MYEYVPLVYIRADMSRGQPLTEPAKRQGVIWSNAAVERVIELSEGR
jgi:hypothetical protein